MPCFLVLEQTCLRESDNSNEEDSLSTHSEDRLSEGSWDRVEPKDTEVGILRCCHICCCLQLPSSSSALRFEAPRITALTPCVCVCVCV